MVARSPPSTCSARWGIFLSLRVSVAYRYSGNVSSAVTESVAETFMNLDTLLTQYEDGSLSRRELLGALALLVSTAGAGNAAASTFALATADTQAPPKPVGAVRSMNHVSIFVPDVKKSVQFYQDLFGMPLLTNQDPGINLSAGAGFLGIYPSQGGAIAGSINHLCFGMENFDAEAVLKQLLERGLKGNIRLRGETKELYFTDPDRIRVQLQDVRYIGGSGVLGDKKPGI